MDKRLLLILCILLPLAVGGLSGYLTTANIPTWYASLTKPSFNPPNYLFGPVWTILYIMMGYALYLITQTEFNKPYKNRTYIYWGLQMILNFFWSILFFHFHQIDIALVEIVLLWASILLTILSFAKINKKAAWLMVPYISWVSFATLLNAAIYVLNK
jgi:translocator protein